MKPADVTASGPDLHLDDTSVRKPAITGPADVRDQRWLDTRIDAIEDGIEAVLDIARNWTDGRNLTRLHPGRSAQDYILARVKHPLGRGVVVPLLAESDWSHGQIAAVAGVTRQRVSQLASDLPVDRPAETLGADGKYRPARVVPIARPHYAKEYWAAQVIEPDELAVDDDPPGVALAMREDRWRNLQLLMDYMEKWQAAGDDQSLVADSVPPRRRAATARRLRKLGDKLGKVAWKLEGLGQP